MALGPRYLADTSALARMSRPEVAARLLPLAETGQLATCGIVDLEVLFSARDGDEHRRVLRDRRAGYARIPVEDVDLLRAVEVQAALAERGMHRAVPIPDLLIAAAAGRAGACVLHYDRAYERIAAVTGQPHEWIVPAGSVS